MMTEAKGASNEKAKRELDWDAPVSQLAAGLRSGTRLSAQVAGSGLASAGWGSTAVASLLTALRRK